MAQGIKYPFLPPGREILYVGPDDPYMIQAKQIAKQERLDGLLPLGAVIVSGGQVIGVGSNSSDYHKTRGCRRIKLRCKSGEGYDLCSGCQPQHHAEASTIRDALAQGNDPRGADLYLFGHWWCCQDCWAAMIAAGIDRVFLLEGSEVLFNNRHPDNVIGHQFDK